MSYFDNPIQDNFKADFGFNAPKETTAKCKNPVFASPYYHRIALMKDYHIGSKGDIDDNGVPGWIVKQVCTGCGKVFKQRFFITDKK